MGEYAVTAATPRCAALGLVLGSIFVMTNRARRGVVFQRVFDIEAMLRRVFPGGFMGEDALGGDRWLRRPDICGCG